MEIVMSISFQMLRPYRECTISVNSFSETTLIEIEIEMDIESGLFKILAMLDFMSVEALVVAWWLDLMRKF